MSLPGKLLRLGPGDWRDLVAAQVALLRAQGQLRWRPVGTLVRREAGPASPAGGDAARARALARAITRAAAYGVFRPRCLARALALRDLLLRHDVVGSRIRVGVRRNDGRFQAHAWVTWGDEVLGDNPAWVAQFTEVDDLRVLRDA